MPRVRPRLSQREEGMLIALGIVMAQHGESVIVADALYDLGLHAADLSGLDEYDRDNLRPLQGQRINGSKARVRFRGLTTHPHSGASREEE